MKNINTRKTFCLLFILVGIVFSSYSQENYFKISTQFRTRLELRNGYRTLMTDSSKIAFFIGQRSRLIIDYKKDKIQIFSSIQDSRTWGDEEQRKDIAGLQVNELWLELHLKKGFTIKLGRQEFAYDDHRLLGNLDWANLSISHDAALLKYNDDKRKFTFHIGGAFNQIGESIFGTTYTLKNYKVLGLFWSKKEFNKGHSISDIIVINGLNSTVANNKKLKATYTIGLLYNYNLKSWKATLGAYYQGGKTENNLSQSAIMLNAYVEGKFKQSSIGLGLDYLSGNTDKTSVTKSNNFNTLYATNHKFYGYMDYFLNIPVDCKQRGLIDVYGRLSQNFTKTLNGVLDVHHFLLANENNLGSTKIKRSLGTEADILVNYKPLPYIHLQLGYSVLFATKNMEYLKGGNSKVFNTWAYLMLNVSPTLFYHEIIK